MRITPFNKAIVSGIALIADTLVVGLGDNVLNMTEKQHNVTTVITVVLGIYSVWKVPNAKPTDV